MRSRKFTKLKHFTFQKTYLILKKKFLLFQCIFICPYQSILFRLKHIHHLAFLSQCCLQLCLEALIYIIFEGELSTVRHLPVAASALEVSCSFSLLLDDFLEGVDVVQLQLTFFTVFTLLQERDLQLFLQELVVPGESDALLLKFGQLVVVNFPLPLQFLNPLQQAIYLLLFLQVLALELVPLLHQPAILDLKHLDKIAHSFALFGRILTYPAQFYPYGTELTLPLRQLDGCPMMFCLYLCPLPLLVKVTLGYNLILLFFAVESQLHSLYVIQMVIQLVSKLCRSLPQLNDRVVLLLFHFEQTDPQFLLLLRRRLHSSRKSSYLLLEKCLAVQQICIVLSQLPRLEPERVDLLDHFELGITAEVKICLELSILVLDAVVQDAKLVVVVSFHLAQLGRSVESVRLRLIGQFFQEGLIRSLHLLLLVQDVLQFLDQPPHLLSIRSLCLRHRVLILFLCPQQVPHQHLHLSPQIGVFLAKQVEFLRITLVIFYEDRHVVLNLCHFGCLVALCSCTVLTAYPLH